MRTTTRRARLPAVTLACLLALALAPAVATGQGAEQEYNLDLPGSGANADTPPASSSGSESDSDGFPAIVVVLVGGAAVLAGFAGWRLRKAGGGDEPDAPS